MDVILLSAGLGTRLRPLTNSIPKCLAPINGYPILIYWLDYLNECEFVSRIFINTHYLKDMVDEFLGELKGLKKKLIILHEPKILGTGQTTKNIIRDFKPDEILIIHADNYTSLDLQELHRKYKKLKDDIKRTIICSFETNNPSSCGMLETNNENIMTEYVEKPSSYPGNKANAAVFITDKTMLNEFFDKFPRANDLCKDYLPTLVDKSFVHHIDEYHVDIGTIGKLKSAEKYKKEIKSLRINNSWLLKYQGIIDDLVTAK